MDGDIFRINFSVYKFLGDTYVDVSPFDFVKIFIIRWYVTKSTYHLLISSRFLFIY